MSTVSRDLMRTLRPAIDSALAQVAKAHGLASLNVTTGTFNPDAGNFRFTLEGVAEGGIDKSAATYEQARKTIMRDLPPLGHEFVSTTGSRRCTFKIVGMNSTGSKVHVRRVSDDKSYTFPADALIALCRNQLARQT